MKSLFPSEMALLTLGLTPERLRTIRSRLLRRSSAEADRLEMPPLTAFTGALP